MKKKAITFFAILLACGTAVAQDTIMIDSMNFDSYYQYVERPDPNKRYTIGNINVPNNGGEVGLSIHIDDSLTIYGIAAAIREDIVAGSLESTLDSSYEYLRLYKAVNGTLRTINESIVYLGRDILYILNCDAVEPARYNWYYSEMHECYFDSPTTVYDSFYLGYTCHLEKLIDIWNCPVPRYPAILITTLKAPYLYSFQTIMGFDKDTMPTVWRRSHIDGRYPLIFPILTPPTVGVQSPQDRLTGIMPNPASETARVVSSFGMNRVEIYDMNGRSIDDIRIPDGSLYTNLDVRRWPQGVYIVRIHTPLGVTSKKLTVQR